MLIEPTPHPLPWEEWRLQFEAALLAAFIAGGIPEADAQYAMSTFDWQAARDGSYTDGLSPAEAVSEELYALSCG